MISGSVRGRRVEARVQLHSDPRYETRVVTVYTGSCAGSIAEEYGLVNRISSLHGK